jgi:hypothetical protein
MARKRLGALKYSKQMVDDISQLVFCICGSTATATASGPTQPCVAMSPTPGRCCPGCTSCCAPTARPAISDGPPACRPAMRAYRAGRVLAYLSDEIPKPRPPHALPRPVSDGAWQTAQAEARRTSADADVGPSRDISPPPLIAYTVADSHAVRPCIPCPAKDLCSEST